MSPERWNQLRSLYDLALDYEPSERLNVLSSQAGADKDLVDEVLRMIELDNGAGDFLEESPARRLRQQLTEPRSLFEPGESVAQRFNVIRLIGSGGMGEVYEAEDTDLGERIALKTLRIDRLADPKAHARLRREALLARKITHPNVCRIFDILRHQRAGAESIGESGEEFAVLSMELLSGLTLNEHLKQNGPFTPAAADPIIRQVLSALIAAHQVGVIHRDLKPSNIMLVEGRAVVTDFGLAITGPTSTAAPLTSLTHSGQFIGTPEYMAPEQIRNQPVTPQSDIYSLGVVIYEMLTGQRPTQGATGLEEILNRVLEAPPSPRSINPTLSRHWEAIILRCLERDPARRFQSVADLLVALESKWQLPRFAPSRRTILTVSGSLAVIAAGSRYWYQKPFLAAKLLLVPLENHTADHEFENLTSMLLHQLSQSPSLELITQNRMQQLQEQLGLSARAEVGAAQYREMALRDGAAGVVFSSLSVSGSEYNLHFRIEESGGTPFKPGRTWSKDFAASSKRDLFSRIDDASRWLRQQSGEALDQIARADRPVEDTTTNSWEAWRLYWDSKVLAAKSDLPGAIALIDEALRLDPVFAMAWRDRADYQIRLHEYREGFESWSKALAALDARRNTSLEALRTRAMYFEDVWKPSAAEEVYRRILAIRPGDYPAVLYLGSVVARQRRLNEAMQLFESALSLHPEKIQILTHIMPLHLSETRLDEANEVASRLRTSGLIAWADYADFNVAMTARKWGKALGSARNLALTGDKLWQVRGSLVLASCCGTLGRFSEALQALENALKAAMRHGSREWIERLPVWILHLELKQSQRSFSSVLSQWRALNATLRSPASIADYCFLGTLLGVKVSEAGSSWPDLPPFLARQKLLAFFANPSDQTGRAVLLASEGCPAFIARDLHESVASIFLHLRRSDAASIQALHKGQLSSWWANELNIPARIQVN